jgi:hypothetical protein
MEGDKGEKDMANFTDFLDKNKEKIRKVAESNTVRNEDGLPVITKQDPWRKESHWDEVYKSLKDKS